MKNQMILYKSLLDDELRTIESTYLLCTTFIGGVPLVTMLGINIALALSNSQRKTHSEQRCANSREGVRLSYRKLEEDIPPELVATLPSDYILNTEEWDINCGMDLKLLLQFVEALNWIHRR